MHMTCSVCRHSWCWVCTQPWSTHSAATGGYYACNRFVEAAADAGQQATAPTSLLRGMWDRVTATAVRQKQEHYISRHSLHEEVGCRTLLACLARVRALGSVAGLGPCPQQLADPPPCPRQQTRATACAQPPSPVGCGVAELAAMSRSSEVGAEPPLAAFFNRWQSAIVGGHEVGANPRCNQGILQDSFSVPSMFSPGAYRYAYARNYTFPPFYCAFRFSATPTSWRTTWSSRRPGVTWNTSKASSRCWWRRWRLRCWPYRVRGASRCMRWSLHRHRGPQGAAI